MHILHTADPIAYSLIHLHKTRQQNQPHIIHRRTAFISKTFIHQAPDKWYKLPENIRQLRSVNNFNRNVKKHLINAL